MADLVSGQEGNPARIPQGGQLRDAVLVFALD